MTIQEDFETYHRSNPLVWELFQKYALEAAAHRKRFGAKAVWERMRWHLNFDTKDDSGFKLNNNYTSRYARLFQDVHPEHAGLIETRRLHEKEVFTL